jgi:murein DD-endopeptidase MepM/ murein hydrolase activator NlpD
MTNNDKFYTFLFSRSTRSRIYIKRVSFSKKYLRSTFLGFALIIGFTVLGIGFSNIIDLSLSGDARVASNLITTAAAQLPANPGREPIDYSRPDAVNSFAINSGGPENTEGMDAEDIAVEKQLQVIQTTSDPATVPAIWAHAGKINNEFGFRRNPFGGRTYEFHAGMDIDGERGDIVVAPASGTVVKAGWQGGYGNMVEVDHGNGLITRYGHLSHIDVENGDKVSRGQLLGLVGSTGRSTGPHLHYELRLNDKPINPRRFLPPEPTELAKLNN